MRWPWRRRPPCEPSEDARHAVEQANRHLEDTHALGRAADELLRRADELGEQWAETRRQNHVTEAVVESIKRKVRHP